MGEGGLRDQMEQDKQKNLMRIVRGKEGGMGERRTISRSSTNPQSSAAESGTYLLSKPLLEKRKVQTLCWSEQLRSHHREHLALHPHCALGGGPSPTT